MHPARSVAPSRRDYGAAQHLLRAESAGLLRELVALRARFDAAGGLIPAAQIDALRDDLAETPTAGDGVSALIGYLRVYNTWATLQRLVGALIAIERQELKLDLRACRWLMPLFSGRAREAFAASLVDLEEGIELMGRLLVSTGPDAWLRAIRGALRRQRAALAEAVALAEALQSARRFADHLRPQRHTQRVWGRAEPAPPAALEAICADLARLRALEREHIPEGDPLSADVRVCCDLVYSTIRTIEHAIESLR